MPTALLAKRADLGGSGDDQSFEQAFSNLAFGYISDAAPGLLDYMVGFQLVDRDEENSKAVGLFGFKLGSQWLYAPVFFINGQLRGHELLYRKGADKFVPLKENWIDHLLAKKPQSLGTGVDRDPRRLGVRSPDLYNAMRAPRKIASAGSRVRYTASEKTAMRDDADLLSLAAGDAADALAGQPDWVRVAVPTLAKAAARAYTRQKASRLLDHVAGGGQAAVFELGRHLRTWPLLKAGFDAFYAPEAVKAALEKAASVVATPPRRKAAAVGSVLEALLAEKRSRLEVHRLEPGRMPSVLLDNVDKEALLRDGILFKDARDDADVSTAYAVPIRLEVAKRFTNPSETGIYEVLTRDGSLVRCLVLTAPLGSHRSALWCTVVRLDGNGKKAFLNIHPSRVWVASGPDGWQEWFDALPAADSLSPGPAYRMVIASSGWGSAPFRVERDLGDDAGGGQAYEVRFDTYARHPNSLADEEAGNCGDGCCSGPYDDGQRLHLGQRTGSRMRNGRGDLYVPAGAKLLALEPDEGDEGKADESSTGLLGRSEGAEEFVLGDALDVESGLMKATASLKVAAAGPTVYVGGVAMKRADALVHLVADLGLREAEAREIIKRADAAASRMTAAEFRVKRADPYLSHGSPQAPSMYDEVEHSDEFFGNAYPTRSPYEDIRPVDDLRSDPGNTDYYGPMANPDDPSGGPGSGATPGPDPNAVAMAQQAGASGQREIFDTSLFASMLRATRDDMLVDRDLPALEDALDKIGRMLFAYYWHGDQFAERYGANEMPELEDSLRNTFEGVGDLYLYLSEKSVTGDPASDAQGVDLSDLADQ